MYYKNLLENIHYRQYILNIPVTESISHYERILYHISLSLFLLELICHGEVQGLFV